MYVELKNINIVEYCKNKILDKNCNIFLKCKNLTDKGYIDWGN